ncbi:MAG: hypothetical protein V4655_14515 [Bdellovibrionota bacterium]|nr:MAG: hypothetical protein EOP10_14050 [Pseudomonadota bacterium]
MNRLPAVIFHLIPVIPFALHYPYVGISALLLVGLAYIKVQKLRVLVADEIRKHGKADSTIIPALEFWERLTFLPVREGE